MRTWSARAAAVVTLIFCHWMQPSKLAPKILHHPVAHKNHAKVELTNLSSGRARKAYRRVGVSPRRRLGRQLGRMVALLYADTPKRRNACPLPTHYPGSVRTRI